MNRIKALALNADPTGLHKDLLRLVPLGLRLFSSACVAGDLILICTKDGYE